MRKYIIFLFCSVVFGCTAAYASEPPMAQTGPPAAIIDPPAAICDCDPCTCPPNECHCPGCKEHAKPVRSKFDELIAAAVVGDCGGPAPAGFRWVQVGNRCTLQPITSVAWADLNAVQPFSPTTVATANPPAALTAGSLCPMCGMIMNAEQAAKANTMTAATRNPPLIPYTSAAPVTYAAPMTYTAPMTYYGAGNCASCSSQEGTMMGEAPVMMGSSGRPGLFGGRARRAARRAGGGGCGG